MIYKRQILIPAPINFVFARCTCIEGFQQQFPFNIRWNTGPEKWNYGCNLDFDYKFFGLWIKHSAKITEFQKNKFFVDEMIHGPFKYFRHAHSFSEENQCTLVQDEINFSLGFGATIDKYIGIPILNTSFKKRHDALFQFFDRENVYGS